MPSIATEPRLPHVRDVQSALHHRLARARRQADLEAVVLASDEGLLLAQDGEPELCEQLAALAPLLSAGACNEALRGQLDATRIAVRALQVGGHALFLAWSGDVSPNGAWLEAANAGVCHILSDLH